jgi:mannose-1-phosphate guanylyltransferase
MKCLLLAAGLGSRLKPLTEHTPKCLMPIHGEPLLGIWLRDVCALGLKSILINTHYLAEQVQTFVANGHYGDLIRLAHEPELLDTAGTLLHHIHELAGDDLLFVHADNYCLADLSALVVAHQNRPRNCLLTMLTFITDQPSACGIVELDSVGVVTGFHEKIANPPGNQANAAVYCLSPEFLHDLKQRYPNAKSFSNDVLPGYVGHIFAHATDRPLIDIGTPENYQRANAL